MAFSADRQPGKSCAPSLRLVGLLGFEIELARSLAGLPFDPTLLRPAEDDPPIASQSFSGDAWNPIRRLRSTTLGEAYAAYLADPTHVWSASTREAYETSRKLAVSVIGAKTPMSRLPRARIRDYVEVLRFLPRNAAKRFPRLSPRAASERCRLSGGAEAMSPANANVCLANLSSFLNWSVNEELLIRNPARGLRLPDDTAKRDKRLPFSPDQLRIIFDAPLYRGCLDGNRGHGTCQRRSCTPSARRADCAEGQASRRDFGTEKIWRTSPCDRRLFRKPDHAPGDADRTARFRPTGRVTSCRMGGDQSQDRDLEHPGREDEGAPASDAIERALAHGDSDAVRGT